MKKKIRTSLLIVLGAILIELIVAPLRGYVSFMAAGIVAYWLYVGYLYLCLSKCKTVKPYAVLLLVLLGWAIIHLPVRIFGWRETLISLPEGVIHIFGILTGYVLWKVKNPARILTVIFGVAICVFYIYFYNLWLNKLSYGTWTGKIEIVATPSGVVFQTASGDSVRLEDYRGRYLVLDFWSSTCGVCYKKFPDVEALYKQYKGDSRVEVLGVFCRLRDGETYATGEAELRRLGYTFGCLSIYAKDPHLEELGVNGYPTVLIFDPQGKLVFRGDLSYASKYLSEKVGRK